MKTVGGGFQSCPELVGPGSVLTCTPEAPRLDELALCTETSIWPGLGPTQMSHPPASTDSAGANLPKAPRKAVKALLRILLWWKTPMPLGLAWLEKVTSNFLDLLGATEPPAGF